jgi:hypothetical protein
MSCSSGAIVSGEYTSDIENAILESAMSMPNRPRTADRCGYTRDLERHCRLLTAGFFIMKKKADAKAKGVQHG